MCCLAQNKNSHIFVLKEAHTCVLKNYHLSIQRALRHRFRNNLSPYKIPENTTPMAVQVHCACTYPHKQIAGYKQYSGQFLSYRTAFWLVCQQNNESSCFCLTFSSLYSISVHWCLCEYNTDDTTSIPSAHKLKYSNITTHLPVMPHHRFQQSQFLPVQT